MVTSGLGFGKVEVSSRNDESIQYCHIRLCLNDDFHKVQYSQRKIYEEKMTYSKAFVGLTYNKNLIRLWIVLENETKRACATFSCKLFGKNSKHRTMGYTFATTHNIFL